VRLHQFGDLLPAVPWLLPFLTLPRLAGRRPNLSDAPTADGILVSVIVPARNEEHNIGTVVQSVLASRYQPLELIVVDDQSTDRTAARVRALQTDSRLRLLSGREVPQGWFGKPWACYQGYRAACGDLLLFADADTRHDPELLGRAVGALLTERAALLTVSPRQRCLTFWERVVMPQIWFLLALRYSPRTVNHARKARDVIANGQFILTTRAAYEAAGTHEAVRHEVAEDLALAQTYLREGLKLHFAFAERLMETRMYVGLAQLIEGWSKNVYLGGRRSFPEEPVRRALVPYMLIVAMSSWIVPPAALLASCAGMRIPAWYGLAYPLGSTMGLYIVLRSTWRGIGKVEWRGRVYSGGTAENQGSG
jgi:chlorobactene glucosyltransferase